MPCALTGRTEPFSTTPVSAAAERRKDGSKPQAADLVEEKRRRREEGLAVGDVDEALGFGTIENRWKTGTGCSLRWSQNQDVHRTLGSVYLETSNWLKTSRDV
jgi:hypothetical protein